VSERPPPALTARQLGQRPGARRPAPPRPKSCTCAGKIPRCDFCFGQAAWHHRETIRARALDWATRSARAVWDGKRWPAGPPRWPPRLGRVAELASDPRIAEDLAVRLHLAARDHWNRWQRLPEPPWVTVEKGRAFSAGPAPRPKAR
jgi:hypothetical protein